MKVLTATATAVSKEKVPRAWTRNAGRGVSRHSGGVNVLRHLGVLIPGEGAGMSFRADGADSESEEEPETGAEAETKWRLPKTKEECEATVVKLQRFVEGWDKIRGAFATAPTTCQEWHHQVVQGLEKLKALPANVPRSCRPCHEGRVHDHVDIPGMHVATHAAGRSPQAGSGGHSAAGILPHEPGWEQQPAPDRRYQSLEHLRDE